MRFLLTNTAQQCKNVSYCPVPDAERKEYIMATFSSLEEAQEYFKGDLFAYGNGMHLDELTAEGCVCSMDITDGHRNANGGVMGGAIFTLGDLAFAVAVNNVHRPTVAMNVSISYLSAPRGSRLIAASRCIKDGRTSCVYQVSITDELGTDVALFTGTGFKL